MLGCADCYQAFREPLAGVLQRIHGHSQHVGRQPDQGPDTALQKVNIYALREQLKRAISEEEYEHAAVLRDQIRDLTDAREEVPHE